MTQTLEHAGFKIRIERDQDPCDPRSEWDNTSHMVCWSRRHSIGDKHFHKSRVDFFDSLFDEIDLTNQEIDDVMRAVLKDEDYRRDYREHRIDTRAIYPERNFDKYELRRRFIKLYNLNTNEAIQAKRDVVTGRYLFKTLYLYDHSGLSISTSPFSCQWDSGQVGYIYLTPDTIGGDREKALACLESAVQTYNQYLTGDVWGFTIEDEDGDIVESCWGFYGEEYCITDAKLTAESIRHSIDEEEAKVNQLVRDCFAL